MGLGKAWMKCVLCGESFEGYHVALCDSCLDRQKPGEDWHVFQERVKAENRAAKLEVDKMQTKVYFKLPAELVDGQHWTPVDNIDIVLSSVRTWCEEFQKYPGESFTIETVEMTEEEVNALPDI